MLVFHPNPHAGVSACSQAVFWLLQYPWQGWQAHWCLSLQGSQEPAVDRWGHLHWGGPAVHQGQPAAEVHVRQARGHRHHGRALRHPAGPHPAQLPVRCHPGKGTGTCHTAAVRHSAGALGIPMSLLHKARAGDTGVTRSSPTKWMHIPQLWMTCIHSYVCIR